MGLWEIIGAASGIIGALGFGALGGYLFYKRKHPVDVEAAQIQNHKSWMEVVVAMRGEIDEMREQQVNERTQCDEKIDSLREDFRQKIKQLEDRAEKAEKQAEKNLEVFQRAQERCVDGCFKRA